MIPFEPSLLFDLSTFPHPNLFNGTKFAWEALLRLKEYLESQTLGIIEGEVSNEAYLINQDQISIGKGTVVEPGAYIKGPCIIGESCTVRHGAYLRGGIVTGNKCVLGHSSEFKNSILLNGAQAAHFAYVGDSILGNNTNLGAGTRLANLRLRRDEVIVKFQGEQYKTNMRKLGAILGDEVQTGCNAVLNPGTIMGKKAMCYPCTNFGGVTEEGQVVR